MDIVDYIMKNRLILIPVIYILGVIFKRTQLVKDKYIPILLLIIAIFLSVLMGNNTIVNNIIQGILVSGTTVLGNQMIKQMQKDE